jgi:hypothetical protein
MMSQNNRHFFPRKRLQSYNDCATGSEILGDLTAAAPAQFFASADLALE